MILRTKNDGVPSIGGAGENLGIYLSKVNDAEIVDRSGKERITTMDVVSAGDRNFVLTVAKGVTYRMRDGSVTSFRYLLSEGVGTEFVACVQVSNIGRMNVIGNIFVRRDFRRSGVATALVSKVLESRKNLVVDTAMTTDGASFFGYAVESPSIRKP